MTAGSRILLAIAGFVGAAGVMAAAGASHGQDTRLLGSIAAICLAHSPLLAAIALHGGGTRFLPTAGWLVAIGTLAFAGDLAFRHFTGASPLGLAAPLGGVLMVSGWLTLPLAAFRWAPTR